VREVDVDWSTSPTGARQTFALTGGAAGAFTGDFPAAASGTVYFVVRAVDNVGNSATAGCGPASAPCQLTFGDRPPVVSMSISPLTGGKAHGTVQVAWTGVDPEGADVSATLVAVDASGAQTVIARAATTSPIAWDTTQVKDGTYTLTLTGSDGSLTNTTSATVVVQNLQVSAAEPLPSSVNAGGNVLLSYALDNPSKTIKSVTAVLHISTGATESVALNDQGINGDKTAGDGTWSALYTPHVKGTYTVDLQIVYSDNAQSTVAGVSTFSAEGAASSAIGLSPAFLGVVVLGATVVALGALGLRRWK
jgi:methionine-rich copper-binding protein CopC